MVISIGQHMHTRYFSTRILTTPSAGRARGPHRNFAPLFLPPAAAAAAAAAVAAAAAAAAIFF